MSYRVTILLSGDGSNLQAIIDATARGELPITLAAVISDSPDAYGLIRATQAGILSVCVARNNFANKRDFEEHLLHAIIDTKPDLIVLAGFMRILNSATITQFRGRIINVHPSLLPKYPGLNTHQRVLDAGDRYHGTTVHLVTEQLDAGPLIAQAIIPIAIDDTADTLQQRVKKLEHQLYPRVISEFASQILSYTDVGLLRYGKLLKNPTCEIVNTLL